MNENELEYSDFLQKLSIQEVLQDAGYQLNKRDGIRYPSYVRIGSDGCRVRGDKFLVTPNGACCFQPPEQKNFNVISFIKEHPQMFRDYKVGMSPDRLVNLVCNRLLNVPMEERKQRIFEPAKEAKPFQLSDYELHKFYPKDRDSQKKFYGYFKPRGIDLTTQYAFNKAFFLATKEMPDGKRFTNLSFPLRKPSEPDNVAGMEERSRPNAQGVTSYKGMARNSNAAEGLWIASPRNTALDKATDVYWFESAFDAMAYYQLTKENLKESIHGYEQMQSEGSYSGDAEMRELEDELKELNKAIFVSTGGNPSLGQMRGMIDATHQANHHLGFDRDEAGQTFAISFAMTKADRSFNSHIGTNGNLVVVDTTDGYKRTEIDLKDFSFPKAMAALGIGHIMKYNEMAIYLKSLSDPQNIFSGDCDLLPFPASSAYGKYESSWQELQSSKQSGLVCKEELDELRQEAIKNADAYHVALKSAFEEYKRQGRQTTYNPCEQGFKDWNDQLLDKRQYSQTDQVETAFDDAGNDVVVEREEDFEENREQEEAEKKHFRFHR